MSKNLIKQPAVRAALVASGNLAPTVGFGKDYWESVAAKNKEARAESQAAAIAARRKELGVKPVVAAKRLQELRMVPTATAVANAGELL